jgi:hypothetical protein
LNRFATTVDPATITSSPEPVVTHSTVSRTLSPSPGITTKLPPPPTMPGCDPSLATLSSETLTPLVRVS